MARGKMLPVKEDYRIVQLNVYIPKWMKDWIDEQVKEKKFNINAFIQDKVNDYIKADIAAERLYRELKTEKPIEEQLAYRYGVKPDSDFVKQAMKIAKEARENE